MYYTFGALGGNLVAHMVLVRIQHLRLFILNLLVLLFFKCVCVCRVTGTGEVWAFLRAVSPLSLTTDW